jgi:nitrate reductase gamma subunit
VDALLVLLEGSALGVLIRQAGVWSYALINLGHVTGVAMLFGAVLLLDLRLIGVWPQVPLAALSVPADRLAQTGFAIAVTSGICLLATNGSEYVGNPFLRIKFLAIGAGLLNVLALKRLPAWRQHRERALGPAERRRLAIAGALSLGCWSVALGCGRMVGYW